MSHQCLNFLLKSQKLEQFVTLLLAKLLFLRIYIKCSSHVCFSYLSSALYAIDYQVHREVYRFSLEEHLLLRD